MIGRSVLVHTRDAIGAHEVARGLRAAGCEVVRSSTDRSTLGLIGARAIDLVLVDHRGDDELAAIASAAAGRDIAVVVVSARPEPTELLDLVCDLGVHHLIAASTADREPLRAVDRREIAITVEKILAADIFGLEKYLPGFAVDIERRRIDSASSRSLAIGEITEYLEALDIPAPRAATLGFVADELVDNALRHTAGGACEMGYGSDGRLFAVSARDDAGTLTPERIRDALDTRDQAGGLGLVAALHSSSQLIFNLAPGRATEVVAVADLASDDDIARAGRSLHVFVDREAAVPRMSTTSVQLSDSMRVDLRSQLAAMTARAPSPSRHRAPTASPRRRPRATPNPLGEPMSEIVNGSEIGLDTLRGILRGASSPESVMEAAVRFLTRGCVAALAYRRETESLVPWMAAGHVAHWMGIGAVEPWLRAPSTPAIVARDRSLRSFSNKRGLDRRIAELVGLRPDEAAWALPINGDDDIDHVLCAFAPRLERVVLIRTLLELRSEIEDALARLRGPEMVTMASARRLPTLRRAETDPPYAELELRWGRAPTDPPYELIVVEPEPIPGEPYESPYVSLEVDA